MNPTPGTESESSIPPPAPVAVGASLAVADADGNNVPKVRPHHTNRPPRHRKPAPAASGAASSSAAPPPAAGAKPPPVRKPRPPRASRAKPASAPAAAAPVAVATTTAAPSGALTLGAAAAQSLAPQTAPPPLAHPSAPPHVSAAAPHSTKPPNRGRGSGRAGGRGGGRGGGQHTPAAPSRNHPANSAAPSNSHAVHHSSTESATASRGGGGGGFRHRGDSSRSNAPKKQAPVSSRPAQKQPNQPSDGAKDGLKTPKKNRERRRTASPPRVPLEAVQEGLKTGKYVQGQLRVNPSTQKCEAYVVVSGFERDILISGKKDRLKALDGDVVAVELDDRSKWKVVESRFNKQRELSHKAAPAPPTVASFVVEEIQKAAKDFVQHEIALGTLQENIAHAKEREERELEAEAAEESEDTTSSGDDDCDPDESTVEELETKGTAQSATTASAADGLKVALRPTGHIVAVIEAGHQEMYVGILLSTRSPPKSKSDKKGKEKKGKSSTTKDSANEKLQQNSASLDQQTDSSPIQITAVDHFAVFVPLDKRCPKMLVKLPRVPAGSAGVALLSDMNDRSILWVARMLHWREHFPHASLVRKLGDCMSLPVQHEYLLINNSIDWTEEFSPQVLACVPKASEWRIPASEYQSRRDLRADCVFSIDPPTAKDLDDALSITRLPNGHFQVGVHIADVSYFVKPGTAIDECAKQRATTVYLVHKAIPMLPRFLSENACSLNPAEDRLSFSVIWELDEQGNKHSEWFGRTVIRSCCKLNYNLVHDILQTGTSKEQINASAFAKTIISERMIDSSSRHALEDIVNCVHLLDRIAKNLRNTRFSSGALRLNSSKLTFQLDPNTGLPCSWGVYEQKDSNFLVEEFMLLANFSVAKKIHSSFPGGGALLRRHPPPLESKLIEYLDICKQLGVELDASSAGSLQKSLEKLQATSDPLKFSVIQHLATKPMQPAKYTHTDPALPESYYHHYALSVDTYTHFTSPIRRYADIIVHRLLHAALTNSPRTVTTEQVRLITSNCNRRKQSADKAQEDCDYLYLCQYLLNSPPLILEGIVIDLRADKSWIIVLVPALDIEEMLMLKDLRAQEKWNADETELSLSWPPITPANAPKDTVPLIIPEVKLQVLSKVQVHIAVNTDRRPMELRLQLVIGGQSLDNLLPSNYKSK